MDRRLKVGAVAAFAVVAFEAYRVVTAPYPDPRLSRHQAAGIYRHNLIDTTDPNVPSDVNAIRNFFRMNRMAGPSSVPAAALEVAVK